MTPRQRVDTKARRSRSPSIRALLVTLATLALSVTARGAPPTFERVQSKPCRALALDQDPYVAALGDDSVTVTDKRGTHEEPLPEALRGPGVSVGVFFGRDYRVRIAGTAHTQAGDEVRYYRSLRGGLKPALDGLGALGKRGAPGLVALLGTVDPEIVCRPGENCLIKRVSGWTKIAAPAGLSLVGLSLGNGWGIAGTTFFNLDKTWLPLAKPGPWQKADAAFVRGEQACVVEHDASRLHHFDGSAWHSSASPVSGPRSVWGDANALWLAGDGGAALLEQSGTFQKLGEPGPVAQVLGRSDGDVWLCGDAGLFRVRRSQP